MKRIILYIFLFTGLFSLSVVVHTPVSFVLPYANLPMDVSGASGTLWQGNIQQLNWRGQNLGKVSWQFSPSQLFKGKAEYALRFGYGSDLGFNGKGIVGFDFSGLYANNVVASIAAKSIQNKVNYPLPIDANGQVELAIQQYRYEQPWCQAAQGTLVWNNSEVNSPLGNLNLGTIIADLSCANSVLSAESNHENGQLAAAFTAELSRDMQVKLDAWFKPNSDFPAGMRSQLKWLGNPDAQGRYPFVYSGVVRY